jgi:hypothetical protein
LRFEITLLFRKNGVRPVLDAAEGRDIGHGSARGLVRRGELPGEGTLAQIIDAHRLVGFILNVVQVGEPEREAGIDLLLHRAAEVELEVALVLDGVAAARRVRVVLLGFIVAVDVIVEGVVGDRERIRDGEVLDDLAAAVQRVRAGARRLVDEDPVAQGHGAGEVDFGSVAVDRTHRSPGQIRPIVDQSLVHPVNAIVLAVAGVGHIGADRDAVRRRHLGQNGDIQRLLVEIHVVVVAAAVVAGEADARGHIGCQRSAHVESGAALLL